MNDQTPTTRPARVVRGPVTLHEKVRHKFRTPAADHPIRMPWPDAATFECAAHTWSTQRPATTADGTAADTANWPDGVKLTATCAGIEVVGYGFEFTSAEQSAFTRWRLLAPCPTTGQPHHWEDRGLRNGCGYCTGCQMFGSDVIDLAAVGSLCVACSTPTWWSSVKSAPGAPDDELVDQSRLVCRDCSPPGISDVLDALYETARDIATAPAHLVAWLAGYVTEAALVEHQQAVTGDDPARARAANSVLYEQIADARAHLVDELIAGRITQDYVKALTAAPFAGTD